MPDLIMQPGDVLAAWGSRSGVVSRLIEDATDGGPSHVLLVYGNGCVIECTLDSFCNGVRIIALPEFLAGYGKGSRVAYYGLTEAARARFNEAAFYAKCDALAGSVHYSVATLLRFLLPKFAQKSMEPNYEKARSMVCCIAAASIERDSGVNARYRPGEHDASHFHTAAGVATSGDNLGTGNMSTLISGHEELTPREVEVVAQILDGNSNQKIAGQLGLTSGTIKVYVAHVFEKLGVSSRAELIIRYARGK